MAYDAVTNNVATAIYRETVSRVEPSDGEIVAFTVVMRTDGVAEAIEMAVQDATYVA